MLVATGIETDTYLLVMDDDSFVELEYEEASSTVVSAARVHLTRAHKLWGWASKCAAAELAKAKKDVEACNRVGDILKRLRSTHNL